MNEKTLIIELQGILSDAQAQFDENGMKRLLATAARDLSRVAPRVRRGSITVVAAQAAYAAPDDIDHLLMDLWGKDRITTGQIKPWDDNWPGTLPRMSVEDDQIYLTPPPSAAQISVLGSTYEYRYAATYTIGATAAETNIPERLHNALIVRAAAEAMFTLSHKGVSKPVALGGSGNGLSMPKNGHPAALAAGLMQLFRELAV